MAKEIEVAFNKGLDELSAALRAFPDSLPISHETRPIETEVPLRDDVQAAWGYAKEMWNEQHGAKEAQAELNAQKNAANLHFYSQKEEETFQEVQQENERER